MHRNDTGLTDPSSSLRRALALVALVLAAALALVAGPAAAAEAPEQVPASVVEPLGGVDAPAVVPYRQIVGAADARNLNAAVVDTSAYWVSAVDREGHIIAARIPRPQPGRDFAQTTAGAAAPPQRGAAPGPFELATFLREHSVAVLQPAAAEPDSGGALSGPMRYLIIPLSVAVIAALFVGSVMLIRRARGGGAGGRGGAAGHGKIRKNAQVEPPSVRFGDVAGCDEAVEELREVVTFLREPERFRRVGARMPRGVILHGPPGTGKTLLAKAVAGEAGVPFFALSGSDFVDTFVGVGASRVRDLFATARKSETGAIIFFDEIDAIGRARGAGMSGADSEREGTLNQLLVELDGFGARDRIVVVAATNRLDMLDAALLRPGRFDRRVQVGLPAETGRLAILRLHSRGMPIAEPESLARLAAVTAGFAGADLANIVNEAAIMAARAGRGTILGEDLDEGLLRAVAGPQRADRRIAEGELETIAWHEAGHALAAELCPTHHKAQRVTILSRGDAGGLALYGSQDRALTSQQHLHERMVVAMAGRAAEQIRFGIISSGAANDLEQVNGMAREAVERLGFSPRVGQIITSSGPHGSTPLSGEVRRIIDEEIGRMVDAAYADAVALLTDHREELDALAELLLAQEQIDRADIDLLLAGLSGGGRRLPSRADALPTARPVAQAAPPVALPEPEPVTAAPVPARRPARRRLPAVPLPSHRGRRVLAGVESAAATLYAVALPRVARRRRRKGPGLA
ncbi:ATP-dependent metallopeptidase FtsH/Yme1/Tma family protein [Miltoncostaea marina]|uniref:ATP-dependent metallopeptidase FtsH/Yme1/Tma family protein n=1 Tax=Miltoncostaea marina TaxID=2843215 RepID=UPI001C3C44AB|nr:AAA family ATPase [Miltoncostaea marina]